MKIPILFLASVTVARALNVFVELGIPPGFVDVNSVLTTPASTLTLMGPGTYTAAAWNIHGNLRMSTQGTYILVATNGPIIFASTSSVQGAADDLGNINGLVTLRVIAPGGFQPLGRVSGAVSLTQELAPVIEAPPPLLNFSVRMTLAAGQTQVAGFVVGGQLQRRMLIRAVGPALAGFGITNALATPIINLFRAQSRFATNDGWRDDAGAAAAATAVGAFPLPAASRDAAMLISLNPGAYTAQVSGGAGEVLLEIYFLE